MIEIIGYFCSVLIGITLGLIGSGGSILIVPLLVYLFGLEALTATGYSLFIVGFTALIGSVFYLRQGLVSVKTAVVFGIPSIISVFLTRAYLVPALPDPVFSVGTFAVGKNLGLMLLFSVLMIAASFSMIRSPKKTINPAGPQEFSYLLILIEGLLVGGLTGMVGAGGGFLIIPALVILSKLPMKNAVATSLCIIAAKSLIGFLGEGDITDMDWQRIGLISLCSTLGIFLGMLISKKVDGHRLKPLFGWFVMLMGGYIILKEILF